MAVVTWRTIRLESFGQSRACCIHMRHLTPRIFLGGRQNEIRIGIDSNAVISDEINMGLQGFIVVFTMLYHLDCELIESAVYLYQATQDPWLLQLGVDVLESIESVTKTNCGYATVKDVRNHLLEDRMESFFLAETTKYLYLLFDPENFLHNSGDHGYVIDTPNGQCVVGAGGYVFNTEAHPIDVAALHCCSAQKKEDDAELQRFHDGIDLLALLGLKDERHTFPFLSSRKKSKSRAKSDASNNFLHLGRGYAPVTLVDITESITKKAETNLPKQTIEINLKDAILKVADPKSVDAKRKFVLAEDMSNVDQVVSGLIKTLQELTTNVVRDNSKAVDGVSEEGRETGSEEGAETDSEKDRGAEPETPGAESSSSSTEPLLSESTPTPQSRSDAINEATEDSFPTDEELASLLQTDDDVEIKPKSFTSPHVEANIRELFYTPDDAEEEEKLRQARSFTCLAQPFHSRLTVWGEFFPTEP